MQTAYSTPLIMIPQILQAEPMQGVQACISPAQSPGGRPGAGMHMRSACMQLLCMQGSSSCRCRE